MSQRIRRSVRHFVRDVSGRKMSVPLSLYPSIHPVWDRAPSGYQVRDRYMEVPDTKIGDEVPDCKPWCLEEAEKGCTILYVYSGPVGDSLPLNQY